MTVENSQHKGDATDLYVEEEINLSYKNKTVIFAFGFFIILGIFYFVISPPSNFPNGGIITVSSGESIKELATDLSNGGYIRSKFLFQNFVVALGGARSLQQGDYYFESPKNIFGLASQIASGEHHLDPLKITIPEGRNIYEIAAIFKSKLSNFDSDIFLKKASPYEGYLYPETYFVYPRTDAVTVLNEMKDMFTKEGKPFIQKGNTLKKSERDIIIMASLIEREAKGSDDREMISGILWNRIDKSIPLQVDASVAYAKGIPENELKKTDMGIDSPYNTYIYRGLPKGPIGNPGELALMAAMHPAKTDYLYYIHDKNGNIHYAKTYTEHQDNIRKYL